jgi:hypothetical protein
MNRTDLEDMVENIINQYSSYETNKPKFDSEKRKPKEFINSESAAS